MDRRQFLAASSIGLTAAAAGCLGSPLSSENPESASGADPGAESDMKARDGEITVSASGEVEAEPDQAVIDVGVEATGESAAAVTEELSTGAAELRTTFDDLEIPEENIEDGRYRVHQAHGRTATGYEGAHSFEVTVTDVDRVGEIIDAVTEAGADDVGHVRFTLREETRSELRNDAIDDALANADEEASHIADNRGVTLEGTTAVSTGDVRVHPVHLEAEAMTSADAASGGAPQTEIGTEPVRVSASVTVTYAFAP
ncbi:SIMPL domain-containing protein [Natrinema limicola]|uniref:DUF541 domain-containing protein n=1 Tax=Natrinema limicola JCM 13563 TaxID=1230457 RepID=M0CS08_9EURY|nr:SIMPL domain-containing protein [Natrinema limicola]ELZ26035.1 hypothetical protein C476_01252 [Natrinema limicola JCM 13563]